MASDSSPTSSSAAPHTIEHGAAERRKRHGLTLVYTGNGKGKTTAALGLVMRAWGRGMPVVVLQFIKHATGNWGEIRAAKKMGIEVSDRGRIPAAVVARYEAAHR